MKMHFKKRLMTALSLTVIMTMLLSFTVFAEDVPDAAADAPDKTTEVPMSDDIQAPHATDSDTDKDIMPLNTDDPDTEEPVIEVVEGAMPETILKPGYKGEFKIQVSGVENTDGWYFSNWYPDYLLDMPANNILPLVDGAVTISYEIPAYCIGTPVIFSAELYDANDNERGFCFSTIAQVQRTFDIKWDLKFEKAEVGKTYPFSVTITNQSDSTVPDVQFYFSEDETVSKITHDAPTSSVSLEAGKSITITGTYTYNKPAVGSDIMRCIVMSMSIGPDRDMSESPWFRIVGANDDEDNNTPSGTDDEKKNTDIVEKDKNSTSPKTGDAASFTMLIVMMGAAISVGTIVIRKKRIH